MAAIMWSSMPIEHVTAVIRDKQGEILFMRRNGTLQLPGGKVRPNETPVEAVGREMDEELGVRVTTARQLGETVFKHGQKRYHTTYLEVDIEGEPYNRQPYLVEELTSLSPDIVAAADSGELSVGAQRFRKAMCDGKLHIVEYLNI